VAKPELGTKRLCAGCGAKFYDLSKDPIVCPKCATVFVVAPVRGRPDVGARAAAEEPAAPEAAEAEFVSLEDADKEASGGKKPAAETAEDDVDVDDGIDDDDDAAFIVAEEDEEDDVTDIIGDGIETDEET
jgi:uncharacterized protein (TIGR02300 family)